MGKTSFIKRLSKKIDNVCILEEPRGIKIKSPEGRLMMYKKIHKERINYALEMSKMGKTVLLDRGMISTLAYHQHQISSFEIDELTRIYVDPFAHILFLDNAYVLSIPKVERGDHNSERRRASFRATMRQNYKKLSSSASYRLIVNNRSWVNFNKIFNLIVLRNSSEGIHAPVAEK